MRLKAYKENRLIPQGFSVTRCNSENDVTFAKSSLSWNTAGAITQALKAELAKLNAQELLDFIKTKEGGQTALDYLAALANGSETSANISAEEAKADILALITEFTQAGDSNIIYGYENWKPNAVCGNDPWGGVLDITSIEFDFNQRSPEYLSDLSCIKMTGEQFSTFRGWYGKITLPEITGFTGNEDFSHWESIFEVDFSKWDGFTVQQFAQIGIVCRCQIPAWNLDSIGTSLKDNSYSYCDFSKVNGKTSKLLEAGLSNCVLPSIALDGSENLGTFAHVDLSKVSGMSSSQFLQVVRKYTGSSDEPFSDCKLPQIAFTGTEDFTNVDATKVDWTKCSGITAAQMKNASWDPHTGVSSMRMTQAQFDAWKDIIAAGVYEVSSATVYVDDVATEIQGTAPCPWLY